MGVTYVTGYGAGAEDITCREPLACTTEMGNLLERSPVKLLQVCLCDGVGFAVSCVSLSIVSWWSKDGGAMSRSGEGKAY